ncbi:MAG: apolipoprotein N-acyltransferase [Rhodobacteraceae bacterium]|nr:apolipoprotein N-acyltransferase [Paracoccaceae bacterium]
MSRRPPLSEPERAARSGRRRRLWAAGACGVGLTLAQAPVFAWPLVFVAIPALVVLIFGRAERREAFGLGWSAGTGYFLTGLYWVAEAFLVDIVRHGWMAPFAIAGLGAGLGLFWGAAAWVARRTGGRGISAPVAFAAALTLAEFARAHALTGFPWGLTAYAFADSPVAQTAALFGPHMLGFLTVLLAGLPAVAWLAWPAPRPPLRAALAWACVPAAALSVAWVWGAERRSAPDAPAPDALQVRLVQPNAAQRAKWDPEEIPRIFARLRALSAPAAGEPAPDVVIWPETAVPWLLEREPEARALIAESAGGAPVLLGARRIVDGPDGRPGWRNALLALDAQGGIAAAYDKRHLVPFGEYMPLHDWLAGLGLGPLVGENGGFAPGAGDPVLRIEGLPPFAAQICYETIFPHEMPGPGPDQRPDWIVQVTNDAWFGASSGPWQHFHQARMRAIEQGLPLVRAANTGVSAVIDARGRVVERLGLNAAGALQAALPPPLPPTPYARSGDLPWMAAPLLALLAAAGAARAGRRRPAG